MTVPRDGRIEQELIDALGSLGNRHRLSILLELAEAGQVQRNHLHTMSFTELYEAVDIESSSQFTYHLDQLVGPFISETAEGYRLTYSGRKVVRALLSGVYESTSSFESEDVAGSCVACNESALHAVVEDELFTVRCRSCGTNHITAPFPRSLTRGRSTSEIIESIGCYIWGSFVHLQGGVCPECYGRVETTLESHNLDGTTQHILARSCLGCRLEIALPVEVPVLFHPIAMYELWKSGVTVIETPLWELFRHIASDAITTEIISEDPFEATVALNVTGERYRFRMDQSFTVTPLPCDEATR